MLLKDIVEGGYYNNLESSIDGISKQLIEGNLETLEKYSAETLDLKAIPVSGDVSTTPKPETNGKPLKEYEGEEFGNFILTDVEITEGSSEFSLLFMAKDTKHAEVEGKIIREMGEIYLSFYEPINTKNIVTKDMNFNPLKSLLINNTEQIDSNDKRFMGNITFIRVSGYVQSNFYAVPTEYELDFYK